MVAQACDPALTQDTEAEPDLHSMFQASHSMTLSQENHIGSLRDSNGPS